MADQGDMVEILQGKLEAGHRHINPNRRVIDGPFALIQVVKLQDISSCDTDEILKKEDESYGRRCGEERRHGLNSIFSSLIG